MEAVRRAGAGLRRVIFSRRPAGNAARVRRCLPASCSYPGASHPFPGGTHPYPGASRRSPGATGHILHQHFEQRSVASDGAPELTLFAPFPQPFPFQVTKLARGIVALFPARLNLLAPFVRLAGRFGKVAPHPGLVMPLPSAARVGSSGQPSGYHHKVGLLGSFRCLSAALLALADASRFASPFAQVIQLGAANLASAHHLDRIDRRRIQRKHTLNAFPV